MEETPKKFTELSDREIWSQFDDAVAKGCPLENYEDESYCFPEFPHMSFPRIFFRMKKIKGFFCVSCERVNECDCNNCPKGY